MPYGVGYRGGYQIGGIGGVIKSDGGNEAVDGSLMPSLLPEYGGILVSTEFASAAFVKTALLSLVEVILSASFAAAGATVVDSLTRGLNALVNGIGWCFVVNSSGFSPFDSFVCGFSVSKRFGGVQRRFRGRRIGFCKFRAFSAAFDWTNERSISLKKKFGGPIGGGEYKYDGVAAKNRCTKSTLRISCGFKRGFVWFSGGAGGGGKVADSSVIFLPLRMEKREKERERAYN